MPEYAITFAGRSVLIRHESQAVASWLAFLFGEMAGDAGTRPPDSVLEIVSVGGQSGKLVLIDNDRDWATGALGVFFAAVLFDRVIFHLLNENDVGVALHAAAVACGPEAILIPGQSGSGKSTLAAWLAARGFVYLTDELVFLPAAPLHLRCFTRPLHIKPGARELVKSMLAAGEASALLEDGHGMIVPHRMLNPAPSAANVSPSVLLFPMYRPGTRLQVEQISRAQAGAGLMACNVNGRNLTDHGFAQIMSVAGAAPAWRLSYGSFDGLDETIAGLLRGISNRP